ncbi:protein FAM136A [Culicoides brevitarsis]|uniref:protein FAM136A n=1 Tax=Culicoides brevitarsis TaxID=469753 RepID=UPI00307B80AD
MVEEQSRRIEHEITKIVDDLDKSFLRKMQVEMHLCAAKCCENQTASLDSVQSCVERCSLPLTRSQNYVQNELQYFQKRLQRCVMDCNDSVRDRMPASPSNDDISKYTNEFEKCAKVCVDKQIGLLPNIVKKIKSTLAKGNIPDTVSD